MKIRRFSLITAILIVGLLSLIGRGTATAEGRDVRLFAAASTASVMTDLVPLALERTGLRIIPVTAATSALARQIKAGAPADIFIAANQAWMDNLISDDVIAAEDVRPLIGNRLVVVSPSFEARTISGPANFLSALGTGRLALADPRAVPAGQYAKSLLSGLDLWEDVAGRLAPAANVRAALALVERGATPLGIVYESDAKASSAVTVAWTPSSTVQPKIVYTAAPTKAAREAPAIARLMRFLVSGESMAVFKAHGFRPL